MVPESSSQTANKLLLANTSLMYAWLFTWMNNRRKERERRRRQLKLKRQALESQQRARLLALEQEFADRRKRIIFFYQLMKKMEQRSGINKSKRSRKEAKNHQN